MSNFYKRILGLIFIITVFSSNLHSQDTSGIFFNFGFIKGQKYQYLFIKHEGLYNANQTIIEEATDTILAELKVIDRNALGSIVEFSFSGYPKGNQLPDPIYSIPVRIALDSNNNSLTLINTGDFQKYLYKQIDSLFYAKVYDSATVAIQKMRFGQKKVIEELVSKDLEEFFTIFSRQFNVFNTYSVGKPIYHPFDKQPFLASGVCNLVQPDPLKEVYFLQTEIKTKEDERQLLMDAYNSTMKMNNTFNPSEVTPAVDLAYKTYFIWDRKTAIIKEFRVENSLRVGDQTKVDFTKLLIINLR